jgi:cobaltochelatase CobS
MSIIDQKLGKRKGPLALAIRHVAERVDILETGGVKDGQSMDDTARSAIMNLSAVVYNLRDRVNEAEAAAVKVVEVRISDKPPVQINGAVHPVFDEVLELAVAREHVFLPGPAGCGKSHLAHQIADALGLKFRFISCSAGLSESQLLGRMIPAGENGQFIYLGTGFLDCYENGGVFLFDELDAADSNVLLVVNSALANGELSVPSRHDNPIAKRHPDFVCIAAANTYGKGADRQYVGRNELDESTLDRFRMGTVPMDYDRGLEQKLCSDSKLLNRLWSYRERITENRLERIVSTRFIAAACRAVQRGKDHEYVDAKLFAGWRADEIRKVKGC